MALTALDFAATRTPRSKSARVEPMSFSEPMEAPRFSEPGGTFDTETTNSTGADLGVSNPFGVTESEEVVENSMFGSPIYQRKSVKKNTRPALIMGLAAAALAVGALGLILATRGGNGQAVQTAALEPAPVAAAPSVTPAPLTPAPVAAAPVGTAPAPERLSLAVNQPVREPARAEVRAPARIAAAPRRAQAAVATSASAASSDASAQAALPVIVEATPASAPAEIVVPIIE